MNPSIKPTTEHSLNASSHRAAPEQNETSSTPLIMKLLLPIFFTCTIIASLSVASPQAYAEGNKTLKDIYGVSRSELITWMSFHEDTAYYLTTRYMPYDWRSPNGDINAWGSNSDGVSPGMNCTGFVWHALCAAHGWQDNIAYRLPALQGWANAIKNEDLHVYYYSNKADMLRSGVLEKGDVIWMFDNGAGGMNAISDYHHVGIFWGNSSDDDLLWHSTADNTISWIGANRISPIESKVTDVLYCVIKLDDGGQIDLEKTSARPELSTDNACYSLQDAVYGIYQDNECTTEVATLTTDANGYAKSTFLSPGIYYVRENTPPPGYARDTQVYPVTVSSGQTARVNVPTLSDIPQSDAVEILIDKIDRETSRPQPQGAATLEGAHFEISFYGGNHSSDDLEWIDSSTPLRTWIVSTDSDGYARLDESYLVSGDEFFKREDGTLVLPLGTVVIKEVKAPQGYLLSNEVYIHTITPEGHTEDVHTYHMPTCEEQIKRGDLELTKVSHEDMQRLSDIPFALTSKTTGERHVIVTDTNGYASTSATWNPHSFETNRGATSEDGIWFGSIEALDDDTGALPYDTYFIEELRSVANADRELFPPFEVKIERDNHTVNLGTLTNNGISISTYATNEGRESKDIVIGETATVVDEVNYTNLNEGLHYRMVGILMDKETEQSLSIDGKDVTTEVTFTPVSSDGMIELKFNFDARSLNANTELVVFEELYLDEVSDAPIAIHADISDEGQTVKTIPASQTENGTLPKTGDILSVLAAGLVTIGALSVVLIARSVHVKRKRRAHARKFY